MTCKLCDQPVLARGLCKRHYEAAHRRGEFGTICSVPGCGRGVNGHGLCAMHQRRKPPDTHLPSGPKPKPIQHGTIGGYNAHFRRGTSPCQPCRRAARDYQRRRRGGHTVKDIVTQPEAILDQLETEDRWLPTPILVDLVRDRHPEWHPLTLERVIQRLHSRGHIRQRLIFGDAYWRVA